MLPIPILDDKTFAQLIEDAKKQIPRYAPEWTDYNVHDPGIAMLELLAWLAEGQRYYLDQVRGEHIRKYLKLLGVYPARAKPARAEATFAPNGSGQFTADGEAGAAYDTPIRVPQGTQLLAGDLRFVTEQELYVTSASLVSIVTLTGSSVIDQTESAGHEGLSFKAFGDKAEAGSSLYLGFDRPIRPGTLVPVAFGLFDDYPVPIAAQEDEEEEPFEASPSVELEWEYWTGHSKWAKLEVASDETAMLTRSGRIVFRAPDDPGRATIFPVAAANCCWFRCTVRTSGYELAPRIDSIMLHTVPVVQLDYVDNVYVGRSNGLSNQSFEVKDGGGIALQPPMVVEVLESGEEPFDGRQGWSAWSGRNDLDASGPDDSHYMLDAEGGVIRFGDGLRGKVPPASAAQHSIRMSYYKTAGSQGNVSAGSIRQFADGASELAKRLGIAQLMPAAGGVDAESIEDAFVRAVKELKRLTRAVTDDDYERLACGTPGLRVARAKALQSGDNAVTVVVVPYSDKPNPQPSAGFLNSVARYLNRRRLVTTRVAVIAPKYVKVQVSALVTINGRQQGEEVAQAAAAALSRYLHPLEGGPRGTGWTFGRTVYLSELYALIDEVSGVDSVQRLQMFNPDGGGRIDDQGNFVLEPNALAYSDSHRIEIELPWFDRPSQEGAGYARIGSQ